MRPYSTVRTLFFHNIRTVRVRYPEGNIRSNLWWSWSGLKNSKTANFEFFNSAFPNNKVLARRRFKFKSLKCGINPYMIATIYST